jgi:hypothetical protein
MNLEFINAAGRMMWMNKNNVWFKRRKVFSDKYVKKNFPELGKHMKVGDSKSMNLGFSELPK